MTFYIEQLGLCELRVHSTLYCENIKSRGTLTEKEVSTTSVGEAARVVRREAGLVSVLGCGVCGGSYRPSGTGGSTGGGHIEEEEPLQG
jgi:hypothetical protein